MTKGLRLVGAMRSARSGNVVELELLLDLWLTTSASGSAEARATLAKDSAQPVRLLITGTWSGHNVSLREARDSGGRITPVPGGYSFALAFPLSDQSDVITGFWNDGPDGTRDQGTLTVYVVSRR